MYKEVRKDYCKFVSETGDDDIYKYACYLSSRLSPIYENLVKLFENPSDTRITEYYCNKLYYKLKKIE